MPAMWRRLHQLAPVDTCEDRADASDVAPIASIDAHRLFQFVTAEPTVALVTVAYVPARAPPKST
jgi:hypothetical protein